MTVQVQKPERKIIQISAFAGTKHSFEKLYALCDDDTIWCIRTGCTHPEWHKMPPIPQDDAP